MTKWVRCDVTLTAAPPRRLDVEYIESGDGGGLIPKVQAGMLRIRTGTTVAGRYTLGWLPLAGVFLVCEVA